MVCLLQGLRPRGAGGGGSLRHEGRTAVGATALLASAPVAYWGCRKRTAPGSRPASRYGTRCRSSSCLSSASSRDLKSRRGCLQRGVAVASTHSLWPPSELYEKVPSHGERWRRPSPTVPWPLKPGQTSLPERWRQPSSVGAAEVPAGYAPLMVFTMKCVDGHRDIRRRSGLPHREVGRQYGIVKYWAPGWFTVLARQLKFRRWRT